MCTNASALSGAGSQCQDGMCISAEGNTTEWFDSDGPYFTCSNFYNTKFACCAYGNDYANGGLTANDACCDCADVDCSFNTTTTSTMVVYEVLITITINSTTFDTVELQQDLQILTADLIPFAILNYTNDNNIYSVQVAFYFESLDNANDFATFVEEYPFTYQGVEVTIEVDDVFTNTNTPTISASPSLTLSTAILAMLANFVF
jgi:hypothetical protein